MLESHLLSIFLFGLHRKSSCRLFLALLYFQRYAKWFHAGPCLTFNVSKGTLQVFMLALIGLILFLWIHNIQYSGWLSLPLQYRKASAIVHVSRETPKVFPLLIYGLTMSPRIHNKSSFEPSLSLLCLQGYTTSLYRQILVTGKYFGTLAYLKHKKQIKYKSCYQDCILIKTI